MKSVAESEHSGRDYDRLLLIKCEMFYQGLRGVSETRYANIESSDI